MSVLTPAAVRAALAAHSRQEVPALPGRTNHLRAGVLVPIAWDPDPVCWMTLRSPTLRRHAGEVCFPGGKPEPDDRDLEHTARREAVEEVGVRIEEMLGQLSSMPLYTSDYRLEPFVARVDPHQQTLQPSEVARVLPVDLLAVLRGPPIDAIAYEADTGTVLSPVFVLQGHPMFGGTAHAFWELLEVLAPVVGVAVPPLVTGRFSWDDLLRPTPRPQTPG